MTGIKDAEALEILRRYGFSLSLERQRRVQKLRKDSDKKINAYAEFLLKFALYDVKGISPQDIKLYKNSHGKPYLVGQKDLFFNISHSSGSLALGISSEEIGVDIEKIRPAPLCISERYFSEKEREYIGATQDTAGQSERFFEIWTKKEAFAKRNGLGLAQGLQKIHVLEAGISGMTFSRKENGCYYSVCCMVPERDFTTEYLSEDTLLAWLEDIL